MKKVRLSGTRIGLIVVSAVFAIEMVKAQERIGTVRQPSVGGSVIDAARQEEFGLLGYSDASSGCSASLLRNGWAITAAHCVDAKDKMGNFIPDPARPGQNLTKPLGSMTLTADWRTPQTARAIRVETFRPYDIALIQLDMPLRVQGSTTAYSRLVFADGQFPHFGEPVGANLIIFGQGINKFATGTGDAAVPSSSDGMYRLSYARANRSEANLYWYPSEGGQMIAGGDSGGPSFAWGLSGYALVGVHSKAKTERVPDKPTVDAAGNPISPWMWVTATPEAADAPIAPVWDKIYKIIGPGPASGPSLDSPPPGFIGTFSKTPPNYQPLWLYGIQPGGDVIWYRKDSNAAAWQGPRKVGSGWNIFKDVIPAGGNCFYGLTKEGKLNWYQHAGFNTGTTNWTKFAEVGNGWSFTRIFSGGEGIIYALKTDGTLVWYRNNSANHASYSWLGPKVIGSGWSGFRDIFSTGKGAIYVVRPDGKMSLYQHDGYPTGEFKWQKERVVGAGWHSFQQIIPCGDGVILGILANGEMLWYRHRGYISAVAFARPKETWDGPVSIGKGWQDFSKVVALIPDPPAPVR